MKDLKDRETDLLHVLEARAWSRERGRRVKTMAERHAVSEGRVRIWIKRYQLEGVAGWTPKKRGSSIQLPVEIPRAIRGLLEREPDISVKAIQARLLVEHGNSEHQEQSIGASTRSQALTILTVAYMRRGADG